MRMEGISGDHANENGATNPSKVMPAIEWEVTVEKCIVLY